MNDKTNDKKIKLQQASQLLFFKCDLRHRSFNPIYDRQVVTVSGNRTPVSRKSHYLPIVYWSKTFIDLHDNRKSALKFA